MESTNFFCVSLIENIPTIKEAVSQIRKFYNPERYTVICPDADLEQFTISFKLFSCISILPESSILSFNRFLKIFETQCAKLGRDVQGRQRLSWYYQQVLKIAFALDGDYGRSNKNNMKYPIVMWDADTVPLVKIQLFDNESSCLYGSDLESYCPYYMTLSEIFSKTIIRFRGFTVQFFCCTGEEAKFLRDKLDRYVPISNGAPFGEWIADVVIKSVLTVHGTMEGSGFGEQELFGSSNEMCSGNRQRPLRYFRTHRLSRELSAKQKEFLKRLGFQHFTYERRQWFSSGFENWEKIIALASKMILREKINKLRMRVGHA